MTVTILFFGALTDAFGRSRMIDVPAEGVTLADLRQRLAAGPAERAAIEHAGTRAAIDQRLAGDEVPVRPGQEVAFFSPVSGG